jgi:predicted ATP-dependent Lon-type protease
MVKMSYINDISKYKLYRGTSTSNIKQSNIGFISTTFNKDMAKNYFTASFKENSKVLLNIKPLSNVNNDFSLYHGFSADYFSAILSELRHEDWESKIEIQLQFSNNTTNRDGKAIVKTISGLMKLIFPDGKFDNDFVQEILDFAVEMRQYILDKRFDIYGNNDDMRKLEVSFNK